MSVEKKDSLALRPSQTLGVVTSMIRGRQSQLQAELPKHLTAERMLAVALGAMRRNPALLQCSPQSLASAIVAAGRLGLEVDDQLGRAYLVPFRSNERGYEATLIVGYRGLVDLAWRSGMVASIESQAVYEGDYFYYRLGLQPVLKHEPKGETAPEKLRYVYSIVRLTTGADMFEVMSRSQVEAIRQRSKSGHRGPWVTDYAAMARKTVVRQVLRLVPMSVERAADGARLARAITVDEAFERGEEPNSIVDVEQVDEEILEDGTEAA